MTAPATTRPALDELAPYLKPDLTFYDHQIAGIEWMWNKRSFLLADGMGLGKSIQTLAVCAIHASMTVEVTGADSLFLIVCPATLKRNWADEIAKFTDLDVVVVNGAPARRREQIDTFARGTGTRYLVVNYEQIPTHLDELSAIDFGAVIADECFIGEKRISTPQGDKRIDQIQEGDVVYGYDHGSGSVVETTVTGVMCRPSYEVLDDLGSTPNHPYWVDGIGYVPAGDLTYEDIGYGLQEDIQGVRVVPRTILGAQADESLLLQVMQHEGEALRPGVSRETCDCDEEQDILAGVSRYALEADEGEQPFVEPGDGCTYREEAAGEWALREASERRQRHRAERGGNDATGRTRPGMVDFGGAEYEAAAGGVSVALQDRRCTQRHHARDRVRRMVTYASGSRGAGCQENGVPGVEGVDDLAILQPRDFGRYEARRRASERSRSTLVYNIETGTSNYFADGVLVHNCHMIKTPDSKRTEAFRRLPPSRRFMLTGTPILGHVDDLWVMLDQIQPGAWGTFRGFAATFCVYGGFEGKSVVGVKNEKRLTDGLEQIMLRRLSVDVLDLPEVQYITRSVDLLPEQRTTYTRAVKEMILERDDTGAGEEEIATPMVRFLRLKQICSTTATVRMDGADYSAKFDLALADARMMTDDGEKIVVFTQFRASLACYVNRLLAGLPDVPVWVLHGDVPTDDRQASVKAWSAHDGPAIIVCILAVAGVGLNMTAGRNVQFLDLDVTPANNAQAVARVHRIGATGDRIRVWTYEAADTVDQRVNAIIAAKQQTNDSIIEASAAANVVAAEMAREMGR